jgi:hypothetical protein
MPSSGHAVERGRRNRSVAQPDHLPVCPHCGDLNELGAEICTGRLCGTRLFPSERELQAMHGIHAQSRKSQGHQLSEARQRPRVASERRLPNPQGQLSPDAAAERYRGAADRFLFRRALVRPSERDSPGVEGGPGALSAEARKGGGSTSLAGP